MFANDGWVKDITDDLRMDLEYSVFVRGMPDDDADPSYLDGMRSMIVKCGGCPWASRHTVQQVLLEDSHFANNRWLLGLGWQIEPLRCPYCTGREPRPDDPNAAPYCVAPGG